MRVSELEPRLMRFSGVGGIALAAEEWGPADGPVVMLLHGGGQTRHSWKRTSGALAATGRRVIALDARGHGDSEWAGPGGYGPEKLAGDIMHVVGRIDRPVVLVGASMGGLTGLLAAERLGPSRVTGLLLVDVVPRIEQRGTSRIRDFMAGNPEGFATLEEAAEAVAAYLPHREKPRSPEGLRRNLRLRPDGRWYWHWDPAFLQDMGNDPALRAAGLERAAAGLRIPLMLLHGALSDVVSEDGIRAFAELAPHARIVTISRAAHTAAGDDNDVFTQAVLDFVLPLGDDGGR